MSAIRDKDTSVVHIDRTTEIEYPDWMHSIITHGLEEVGPAEVDVARILPWIDFKKKPGGMVTAADILLRLEEDELLHLCFGFREALAIQKKGVDLFRDHFGAQGLPCWKFVISRGDESRYIPFLFEERGALVLHWFSVDVRRHVDIPVYLIPRSPFAV